MEAVFGSHLVKFKKQEEAAAEAEENKEEGDGAEDGESKPKSLGEYCE